MTRNLVIGLIVVFTLLIFIPNQTLFGKSSGKLSASAIPRESIKIVNPIIIQNVSVGKELLISGQSSDNALKNCSVSVIVNDVRPYQNAIAIGKGGTNDFSQWEFVIRNNYTTINENENKITAKLLCTSSATRWNSIFINGVPAYGEQQIVSPAQSKVKSNISPTNFSAIKEDADSNNTALAVSVFPLKNPVVRGDTQNATITVTDSGSRAVANARIDGKLIYPGDNYKKEFKGKTGDDGKFVYSWIIGKNGDVGPLTIEVEASSQGYRPTSGKSSFDITDLSAASKVNNASSVYLENKKSGFDFIVAGDYGCDSKTRQTINYMEKENADLVFALGDLSEVKNPNCFFKLVSKLDGDNNFKVTLGEADTDSNKVDSSSAYGHIIKHFNLKSPFYSFDYNNVHFLAMSTGKIEYIPYENGSEQYKFINDDLSKAANNPNIDWIIVYGYRPLYTSPTIHPAGELIRETYAPLFEKYGVDLVITSHNHNYQRSYPLLFNTVHPKYPIVKDVNATQYYMPGVPIYVGVGTAGNNLYDFRGQAPFMVTQFRETGFLHVNITDTNQDVLNGRFHNIGTGAFDDQFMIVKTKFE